MLRFCAQTHVTLSYGLYFCPVSYNSTDLLEFSMLFTKITKLCTSQNIKIAYALVNANTFFFYVLRKGDSLMRESPFRAYPLFGQLRLLYHFAYNLCLLDQLIWILLQYKKNTTSRNASASAYTHIQQCHTAKPQKMWPTGGVRGGMRPSKL